MTRLSLDPTMIKHIENAFRTIARLAAILFVLWFIWRYGRVVYGQSTNFVPGLDPGTDICTNCPDPVPNPPVPLPQPKTFAITVRNVPLAYTNPLAYCQLYESTNFPPTFVPVAWEPYQSTNVFYRTETAAECFWTASNLVAGINN
jgi:hypothetical protein